MARRARYPAFAAPVPCTAIRKGVVGRAVAPARCPHATRVAVVRRPPVCVAATPETSTQPSVAPVASETYDVVVLGGGPAGLSLCVGLGRRGIRTLCCDATLMTPWPNNYGTWVDELVPLGLEDCVSHVWEKSAAYVRPDGRKSNLNRAYVRVDRTKMKQRLMDLCDKSGNVTIVHAGAANVDASDEYVSVVSFDDSPAVGGPRAPVAGRVIVDATGHKLRFVKFQDGGSTPGFQAAYGIECTVSEESYPYAKDEMLLMDFRDDHMQSSDADKKLSQTEPTFIYVMPLDEGKGRRVFFEETSLVANPAMSFEALKQRLEKRLAYYNITVEEIHDEEFCLIPMGGEMPDLRQRVVAFGGAAALVHPATGYMIARALHLADKCAGIISSELPQLTTGGSEAGDDMGPTADNVSYRVWDKIWNIGRRRQRDFFNFGGEYLRSIDLDTTRDFFGAFFDLPKEQWSGFLSFKLMQPSDRLAFGLGVFLRTTNRVRFSIIPASVLSGGLKLFLSVVPFYTVSKEEEPVEWS